MANVCPTGLFFETQPIERGLFKQASPLQTHKHPSVCLQRKGDQSCICMRMRALEETSLPIKGHGSRAAFVPAPAHAAFWPLQDPRPTSRSLPPQGPRPSVQSPLLSQPTGHPALVSPPTAGQAGMAREAGHRTTTRETGAAGLKGPKIQTEAGGQVAFTFSHGSGLEMRRRSLQPARKKRDQRGRIAQRLPAIPFRVLAARQGGLLPALS